MKKEINKIDKSKNVKEAKKLDSEVSKLDKKARKEQKQKEKISKKEIKLREKSVKICDWVFEEDKYKSLLKKYFAHRGVHDLYPENSLPAFKLALELGYGIELDVHLSKDKELVVFHDDNLKRMTGEDDYVRFKTLKELKELKLGASEFTIPTLKEVLTLVDGKTHILLEIKTEGNTKKLCNKIIEELKDYTGEVFIQSFNPFALRYFYKHAPQFLRGQLSSFFSQDKLGFIKRILIKGLKLNKFAHIDFVAYNIKNLPNKYVLKSKLPVLAWSIRTKEEFKKAKVSSNNLIIDDFSVIEES